MTMNFDPKHRHNASKVDKRILADNENVYNAQRAWRNNAGKFLLQTRHKANQAIANQVGVRKTSDMHIGLGLLQTWVPNCFFPLDFG